VKHNKRLQEPKEKESILVLRASIVQEHPYGECALDARKGTRHFRPGARVYVIDAHWGTCDAVTVIGHHRARGQYAKLDVSVKHLENFRLDRAYSPMVISLIKQHFSGGRQYTEQYAEELLKALPEWKAGT
jgi:hypothetical protein